MPTIEVIAGETLKLVVDQPDTANLSNVYMGPAYRPDGTLGFTWQSQNIIASSNPNYVLYTSNYVFQENDIFFFDYREKRSGSNPISHVAYVAKTVDPALANLTSLSLSIDNNTRSNALNIQDLKKEVLILKDGLQTLSKQINMLSDKLSQRSR